MRPGANMAIGAAAIGGRGVSTWPFDAAPNQVHSRPATREINAQPAHHACAAQVQPIAPAQSRSRRRHRAERASRTRDQSDCRAMTQRRSSGSEQMQAIADDQMVREAKQQRRICRARPRATSASDASSVLSGERKSNHKRFRDRRASLARPLDRFNCSGETRSAHCKSPLTAGNDPAQREKS